MLSSSSAVERVLGEVLGQRCGELAERLGRPAGVHEDEALPDGDGEFGQLHGAGVDVGEVPSRGHAPERAVDAPGEPVERALEHGGVAPALDEGRAAVQARVVERPDPVGSGSHHDHAESGHLVQHVVADLGDVFEPARHLPGVAPQALGLEFGERP